MKVEYIKNYLLSESLATYDPYDVWKTSWGAKIKQLYYYNKYLGLLPAGLLTIFDFYINNKKRYAYHKQEYPIVRAQAAISLLNLYEKEKDTEYLSYAKKHIDWLLENASTGYSGYCWGMNYDWVYSADEYYDKNTPFSTHTPYPLEALIQYYHITKEEEILKVIKSLFLFLENDLQVMYEDDETLTLSYGVEKDRIVTNANSYSMYMYALLLEFFPEKQVYIKRKISKLYNFICSVQQENGSWLYSPYEEDTFIDCFHSAIVLKNIIKSNILVNLNSQSVVEQGYEYILNNFMDREYKLCKRFSVSNKMSLIKFDLYDNAEVLNLAILQEDETTIVELSSAIEKYFVNEKEEIASTLDLFNYQKNFNHLRWAVVPYLNTLSKLEVH
ncbi:MAG: Unknown protein [uncultured Sulfurovum sp.]|uniref:D-glucuronyl C5-epimerase C-terminal domain-containing protein n=1 Tax=uncultured Sulfurovum sp. TaxID=269237 RepID=A0A6S6SCE2_9BACT|nr:MAG: Unknown protein [uncultured Sulfurovum sp.]